MLRQRRQKFTGCTAACVCYFYLKDCRALEEDQVILWYCIALVGMKKGFFGNGGKSSQAARKEEPSSKAAFVSDRLKLLVSQSSAGSLRVESDKLQGRYIVADRNFNPGEVLMTAQYFATVPVHSSTDLCTRCLSHCRKVKHCQRCAAVFCSEDCFNESSAGL